MACVAGCTAGAIEDGQSPPGEDRGVPSDPTHPMQDLSEPPDGTDSGDDVLGDTGVSVLPESTGATIYVSPSGGGDGSTPSTPTTLADGVRRAGAGTTIQMAPGDYGSFSWPEGKNGSAEDPITLRAEHRAVTIQNLEPVEVASNLRSDVDVSLSVKGKIFENIRIDGVYGKIWTGAVRNFEIRNSHAFEHRGRNFSIVGTVGNESENVAIHDSFIEAYRVNPDLPTRAFWTDYGVFLYPSRGVRIYRNVFRGGFNHAISLKQNVHDVTIENNKFVDCGRHCVELGQTTDGKKAGGPEVDRTSSDVVVRGNVFVAEGTVADLGIDVLIDNADDVRVVENRFDSKGNAIRVGGLTEIPTYCRTSGEYLVQTEPHIPDDVLIADNHFDGAQRVSIEGRGSPGDTVVMSGFTGVTPSCSVISLEMPSGSGCNAWASPPDRSPPTVTIEDDSIRCD